MNYQQISTGRDGHSNPVAHATPGTNVDLTRAPAWSQTALARIRFVRHPEGGFGLKMPGPYWVTEATLRAGWKMFWRNVDGLDPTSVHTAEALCGVEQWRERPDGEQKALGRCFVFFAQQRILPITLVQGKGIRKYRLNTGLKPSTARH